MKKQVTLSSINRAEVLRYLGYKGIGADETINSLIDECEAEVLKAAVPRYVYRVVDVTQVDEGVRLEGTSVTLKGNSIKEHLKGCNKAALIAVTISDGIDRMLRVMQASDLAKAVISDSMASAAIEQVCDKVEAVIKEELPEYNQTFRFGIGYGDLPLSPFFNCSATVSVKAFKAFSASFFESSAFSAIAATNSVLFIINYILLK